MSWKSRARTLPSGHVISDQRNVVVLLGDTCGDRVGGVRGCQDRTWQGPTSGGGTGIRSDWTLVRHIGWDVSFSGVARSSRSVSPVDCVRIRTTPPGFLCPLIFLFYFSVRHSFGQLTADFKNDEQLNAKYFIFPFMK